MKQWHDILRNVLENGEKRDDRTGVGTVSLFAPPPSVFDLRLGFPAVTTKKLFFNQVAAELAAFLAGAETLEEFHKFGCNIWNANALAWKAARFEGDVGRTYGVNWKRWRSWRGAGWAKDGMRAGLPHHDDIVVSETDQIAQLVENLRGNPFSRRHIAFAYNPGELDQVCLPACHVLFQCYVSKDGFLDLQFYIRSVDLFIGWPFDIASYALLMNLLAHDAGLTPRMLTCSMGDAHIYFNHQNQVCEVLSRELLPLPQLRLSGVVSALNFSPDQASLAGYISHSPVRATMNV